MRAANITDRKGPANMRPVYYRLRGGEVCEEPYIYQNDPDIRYIQREATDDLIFDSNESYIESTKPNEGVDPEDKIYLNGDKIKPHSNCFINTALRLCRII